MTASFRDIELLSAYLDGQLDSKESARLESRLKSDESLRAVLDDLRAARGILRQLPQRRAPRSFTLTPQMAGIKPPTPRAYPVFRLAAALATLLFLITFVINGLSPIAAPRLAAAPAYGMGGGGGASNEAAPAATQAPATQSPAATEAAQPFAAQSSAGTAAPPAANDNSRVMTLATQTSELAPKAAAPAPLNAAPAQVQPEASIQNQAPVSSFWQIALAVLALIFGVTAWIMRSSNERKLRKQWSQKEN
jgi:anti-sigma factor RsiW